MKLTPKREVLVKLAVVIVAQKFLTEQICIWASLLSGVLEVLGSNLSLDTVYPDRVFIIRTYFCIHYSFFIVLLTADRLCSLVVRVLGYRSGGPGSIPGTTKKKQRVVGLERGPLSLMSTTEELLL
jgi:hypothetical protein